MTFLNKIFKKEYKRVVFNILNFSLFQLTNYLAPIITIPYLVRIIGAHKFGLITFAQALIQYFVIFTDYGFNISGTRKIAQDQGSAKKINKTFTAVFAIRFIIMTLSFVVLIILLYSINSFRKDYIVYLLTFGLVPANILISLWFYTGMERMQFLNYSNAIHRVGYIISIFIFVRNKEDFILVPAINSGFMIIAGIISMIIIVKHFRVKFILISFKDVKQYLIEGWEVFVSNFAINLYRNSNAFILGLIGTKEMVGFYSAGEKLIKVFQSMFVPVTQSLYPYVSRQYIKEPHRSYKSVKILLKILGSISSISAILLIVFAEPVTILAFGKEFVSTIPVIKITSFVIMFGVMNYFVGIIFMLNFGLKRQFFYSVLITAIFNITICILLSSFFYETGTAWAFVLSEFILFANMIYHINKNKSKWRLLVAR